MSVEELIEELRRQPNQRVPIVLSLPSREVKTEVDRVRFDGGCVLIEGE